MIRILHVVTYMGLGGLETMIMNYYRYIDRTKIQFDFLVHRDFEAHYDNEIKNLGGKIFRISKLIPWSRKYKSSLRAFLSEHPEYKIIHVHQNCLSSVILKEAQKCNIPHRIAHAHSNNQTKDLKYPIKLYYKRKISKHATKLLACSQESGEWMFNSTNFQIMNNAIDARAFLFSLETRKTKRQEFGIDDNCFVLGNIGRFSEPKNHSFLLDIFYEFKQLNPNSKLLLVGEGALRNKIESKIQNLKLTESVILTGARTDVKELLQAMDVVVMPSLREGLPVSLIEAQASGLPCVICDHFSSKCDITGLTKSIALNDTPQKWANEIALLKNFSRKNTLSDIQNAGFDIVTNAEWLQNYYMTL